MIMKIHSIGNDFLTGSTVLFYCKITTCMLQIPVMLPQKFMISIHSSLIAIQMEEMEEGEDESEEWEIRWKENKRKFVFVYYCYGQHISLFCLLANYCSLWIHRVYESKSRITKIQVN